MSNPEFQMKGISFVISATTNSGHPLPFKVKLPNGKSAEIQHSLRESFNVVDVIRELRLLATNLEVTAGLVSPEEPHFPTQLYETLAAQAAFQAPSP